MNELKVRLCPVDQLVPYQQNARTHSEEQIAQIAASIQEFGWTNPILVGPDCVVIAGHVRLAAAKKFRLVEVPVIVLGHLIEAQRGALAIADNQLALNAGWDEDLLRVEPRALQAGDFDLDLVGFGEVELAALLASDGDYAGHSDEDAVPETPGTAVSFPGDLWAGTRFLRPLWHLLGGGGLLAAFALAGATGARCAPTRGFFMALGLSVVAAAVAVSASAVIIWTLLSRLLPR